MKLRDYPLEHVRLACKKCGRSGSYSKQDLVERYGAGIELPDLLKEIAVDCPRNSELHAVAMDPCGVIYPDLTSTERVP
jgi:hypothetical protein|tara:strand:- start:9240 stop:9476 length:237 start_codon:yes stop_codon:yes gene_type:complete